MSSAVDIHRSLVCCKAGRVHLVQEEKAERKHPAGPEDDLIRTAATVLMLASYRNQCMHVFVRPAILAAAIHTTRATLRGGDYNPRMCFSKQGGFIGINMSFFLPFTEELFSYFCFLQDVFSDEFIFVPGKSFQVIVSPFFSARQGHNED